MDTRDETGILTHIERKRGSKVTLTIKGKRESIVSMREVNK